MPAVVTAIAEGHCGRPLLARAFDDEAGPDDHGTIRLRTWPVTSCQVLTNPRVVATLAPVAVAGLWSSGFALQFAGVDAVGLALEVVAGGVTLATPVAFAPDGGPPLRTLADLAAAVNAGGSWTMAAVADYLACPVNLLRVGRGDYPGAANTLVAWTAGYAPFRLRSGVGAVDLGGSWFAGQGAGSGWGSGGFWPHETLRVRYRAGYNGDPAAGPVTVPANLAEACGQMARAIVDARKVGQTIKSVNLGNTGYTLADQVEALTPAVVRLLGPFKDRRF